VSYHVAFRDSGFSRSARPCRPVRAQRIVARSAPCIEAGGSSLQIAEAPWNADLHVAFTDYPQTATVRVQIVESAETADFVMVDGADSAEANACGGASRFVAISAYPSASAPIIYLSTMTAPITGFL